ncbi:TPA: transcriptional regulator [Citrobacter amalonaticus]
MAGDLLSLRNAVTREEWERISLLSGTSSAYLNQIALGFRRPSATLAEKIEKAVCRVRPGTSLTKENLVFAPLRKSPTAEV